MSNDDLHAACQHAIRTSRGGDAREGLRLAQRAYRLASDIATREATIEAQNALAICQATNGGYIESIACAIDAFRLAKQERSKLAMLHALTTLISSSNILLNTGEEMLALVDGIIGFAGELGDQELSVRARNVRGSILCLEGRYEESEEALLGALVQSKTAGQSTPPSLILGNLSNLTVLRVQKSGSDGRAAAIERAEKYVTLSLETAMREGSAEAEIRGWFDRGFLEIEKNNLQRAKDFFEKSLELSLKQKSRWNAIVARIELALVMARLQKSEEAIAILELARIEAGSERPSSHLYVVHEQFATLYKSLGKHEQAVKSKALAKGEREEYERERGHVRRELKQFWKEIGDLQLMMN